MSTVSMTLGNVYSNIDGKELSYEVLKEVELVCSYKYETYDHSSGGTKETRISLMNTYECRFPSGLHQRVAEKLEELGYAVRIDDRRTRPEVDIDAIMERMSEFGLALRDYQIDAAIAGVESSSGLFDLATGAGKTVLFIFLLIAYDLPTLILVNRKELMEQISSEISRITGRSVGTIGDGVWQPSKWTVAIVNTLNKGLSSNAAGVRYRTKNYLASVKAFIGDEIHHLGAKSWKDIAKACSNASIRFGFSGTCYHPDSEDLYLVAFTGEVIYQVSPSDLIESGWLAEPKIYMPRVEPSDEILKYRSSRMDWHRTRKIFIRDNDAVIESGVEFVKKMYDKNVSCVFFAGDDLEYGRKITEMIVSSGVNPRDVKFMTGRESSEVRRKSLDDFRNRKFQILGGTSIYDEGVDVPHTGAGANFGQGFSDIKTIQRIGRVLRKTKKKGSIDVDPGEKQVKYYWDPFNRGNRITVKHSEFRESVYRNQRAFSVRCEQFGERRRKAV